VLTGWYEDRDFHTRAGDPAILAMTGSGATFESLVERYVGGGVRASGVLKELLATGAAKITREGAVRAVRRSAAAGGADPATVERLGEFTAALLMAFEHNLSSGPMEQLAIRGVTRPAESSIVPLFRAQMAKRAEALVEGAEAFLDSRASEATQDMLLGSFAFTSVDPVHQPQPRWQRGLATRLKKPAISKPA
jgi:hypothetical protein